MICTYCGEPANTYDHVPPRHWLSSNPKLVPREKSSVPACAECNQTIGGKLLFGVGSRAEFLKAKYLKKYKKVLNFTPWLEDELEDMSEDFQKTLRATQVLKQIIQERLIHLDQTVTADYTWQEAQDLFKNKSYKPIQKIIFKNPKGVEYLILAGEIKIHPDEYLFENSAIEKAIQLAEQKGFLTLDCTVEILRGF